MKKASTAVTVRRFLYWLSWYATFSAKIYSSKKVVSTLEEKRELCEALLLRILTLWEIFAEDLLVDCLNRDATQYAKHVGLRLPKHMTRHQCKAMVTGLGYLDLRSAGELKRIAKNILVPAHNPFRVIPNGVAKKIDEVYVLRNHLSHYSLASGRALRNMYRNGHGLKTFREPGDFLFAKDRKTGDTRLAGYLGSLLDATGAIAKFLKLM